MKTTIHFEKINDSMIVREGDRTRHFQVLSVVGRHAGNVSHVEWDLNEHDVPILQELYQRFCEKNNLRITKEGYVSYREYAVHFGFKFEEETGPVFFNGVNCWADYGEKVYAFYADGSEGFAKFINADKTNNPFEPDHWFRIEDGSNEVPVKWCRIYPYLFD